MESMKNIVKIFLDSSQGEMSLCLFDRICGGQKNNLGQNYMGWKRLRGGNPFCRDECNS